MCPKLRALSGVLTLSSLVALSACSGDDNAGGATPDAGGSADAGGSGGDGSIGIDASNDAASASDSAADSASDAGATSNAAVYTMTNAKSGNAVLGFARALDGSLTPMAAPFATGGKGTGAPLGEQGALALDAANNRLYAVNAGDDTVSIFPVKKDGSLDTPVTIPATAGLVGPKSVTYRGDVVYVLFEGDASNASAIAGFAIGGNGPSSIAGSVSKLSSDVKSVDPAQIEFTPDGKYLVVTEKATSLIDTFAVDNAGVATKVGFYATASSGDAGQEMVPYGFEIVGNYLVVSEAGATGAGVYTFTNGVIAPASSASRFASTDPAPCWVAASADWAYVANARGLDISGFTVSAANGALTGIASGAAAVVASTGKMVTNDGATILEGPTDLAVSQGGKFLYALDAAVPAIGVFAVESDGTLKRVGASDYTPASSSALPAGVVGIVAR